jgi:hypothetical protein
MPGEAGAPTQAGTSVVPTESPAAESAGLDASVAESSLTAAATVPSTQIGVLKSEQPYETANGSFIYRIALDLPAFHGIEPDLRLVYSSSRRLTGGGNSQGWLGFGWALEGFDVIERAGARRGVPRYGTAPDIYLWNGEELLPCAADTASPSCTAGGTHFSKVESYIRFAFNGTGSTSTWTITRRDGVKYVLKTVSALGAGGTTDIAVKYRWLVAQIIDPQPRHNTVSFSWSCPALEVPQCQLSSITYTGTTVNFYWEDRPDPVSYGTGISVGRSKKRLTTVKVTHGGAVQKAFALTYGQNAVSGLSRLVAVTPYGRDATFDAAGTVTGGTALPAYSFQYSQTPATPFAGGRSMPQGMEAQFPLIADVNADGYDDVVSFDPSGGYADNSATGGTELPFRSMFSRPFPDQVEPPLELRREQTLPGHFNSDRYLDFVFTRVVYDIGTDSFITSFVVELSNPDGTYTKSTNLPSFVEAPGRDMVYHVEDANGDGLDRVPGTSGEPEGGVIYLGFDFDGDGIGDTMAEGRKILLSGGGSFYLEHADSDYAYCIGHPCLFADVNGDGLTDYIKLEDNSPMTVTVRLSTGTGLETATQTQVSGARISGTVMADVNGDGRSELIVGTDDGADGVPAFVTLIGDGVVTAKTGWTVTSLGITAHPNGVRQTFTNYGTIGDFNGDGLTDIVSKKSGRFSTAVAPSTTS